MSSFTDMDKFVKEYGKDGLRLLVLFTLIKLKVKAYLRQQHPGFYYSNELLDQLCITKAYSLSKLGEDKPTGKDVEELLSSLKVQRRLRR